MAAAIWTPFMFSYGGVTVPNVQGSYLADADSKPQTLHSAAGWDNVTGIGTPTPGFVAAFAQPGAGQYSVQIGNP